MMLNNYAILDLETTNLTSFKRFCNPLDQRNRIVLAGWKLGGEDPVVESRIKQEPNRNISLPYNEFNYIIGHNVKFDLLYIWNTPEFQAWLKKGGKVMDTMVIEYLLSGQYSKYTKLDVLSEKYGGELKDSRVTDAFEAGLSAEEIDQEMLTEYLIGDLNNTEIVFLAQMKEVRERKMLPLIQGYMEHYLALCELEANGLYVNPEDLKALRDSYQAQLDEAVKKLHESVKDVWTIDEVFNPDHLDHISAVLYNTGISYMGTETITDDDGEPLRYKTGKRKGELKTRKIKMCKKNIGLGLSTLHAGEPRTQVISSHELNYIYPSDQKILQVIAEKYPKSEIFINALLQYREMNKLMSTYIYGRNYNKAGTSYVETGLGPLIHPLSGCVHSSFESVRTHTGRVSSNNPNAQNIPKEITGIFTSRYGEEGQIVAFDYAQLEVCVQAFITQSKNLIQDIKDGVDFHCKRLSYSVGLPYEEVVQLCENSDDWKAKRRSAKTVSFQKAYGAQPEKIAASTGLSVETVKLIFEQEDKEYPEIAEFYKKMSSSIEYAAQATTKLLQIRDKANNQTIERDGETQMLGYYKSVTGKRYHFAQKAVLTKKGSIFTYFPPTEIYNYPIQGCQHPDTLIMTKKGLYPIKDLVDQEITVWSEDGWSRADCVYAGLKHQVKITFKDGREIISSPEHKYLTVEPETLREVWYTSTELLEASKKGLRRAVKLGPKIEFHNEITWSSYKPNQRKGNGFLNRSFDEFTDLKKLGEVLGRLASDGSIRTDRSLTWFFADHESDVEQYILSCIPVSWTLTSNGKTNVTQEVRSYSVASAQLAKQVETLKREMPEYLWKDSDLLRGYLRGMFDGDGTVTQEGIAVLTFGKQAYKESWAKQIQLALTMFGIRSRVRTYNGDRTVVQVMKADAELFAKEIGFINIKKQQKLKLGGMDRKRGYFSYIKSVELLDGKIEMYDIVNSTNKIYCANGLVTHNTAADIVALQVGRVFRYLLTQRDKGVMINEVHDSLLLDVKKEYLAEITEKVKMILEDVDGTFKKYFKIDFNVPIRVDMKIGDRWE